MRAGQLRHRITIQENNPTRDGDGGLIDDWSALATVWAAVEPLNGAERQVTEEDQLLATRMTRIRIRKRDGLDATKRVVFGSQVFNIRQIIHVETANREMWLVCEEIGV